MADSSAIRLDVVLVHYPVVNRGGEIISSAVTNLDVHDIARAGCTFGIEHYWLVTPFEEQRELTRKIVSHWTEGYGSGANPDRGQALSLVRICWNINEVIEKATEKWGERPLVLATCARPQGKTINYGQTRCRLHRGEPILLLFGTAWGLAPEVLQQADFVLPPIQGRGEYNHLSVRSAVSIILDRLLGCQDAADVSQDNFLVNG